MSLVRLVTRSAWRNVLLLAAVATSACDDGQPTTVEPIVAVGRYTVVTFVVVIDGTTYDLIQRGARIDLTLRDDQRTAGEYHVPAVGPDGVEVTTDLTGSWTMTGVNRLVLLHDVETYLRGITLTADGTHLFATGVANGVHLNIVLRRV